VCVCVCVYVCVCVRRCLPTRLYDSALIILIAVFLYCTKKNLTFAKGDNCKRLGRARIPARHGSSGARNSRERVSEGGSCSKRRAHPTNGTARKATNGRGHERAEPGTEIYHCWLVFWSVCVRAHVKARRATDAIPHRHR
jgi:hypothetical protein